MGLTPRAKTAIAAVVLFAAGTGGYVYWTMFHVDAEFAEQDAANKQEQKALDRELGLDSAEDDFDDLAKELEEPDK